MKKPRIRKDNKQVQYKNLTNKSNLPEVIMQAVQNDSYTSSESDISVTSLIKPARIRALEKQHKEYIEQDVSDLIFTLLGQSVHSVIERAVTEDDIAEMRLFYEGPETNDWTMSGQFDYLTGKGELIDFKVTSAWTALDALQNGKTEWEQQLNILDFLCYHNPKLLQNKKNKLIEVQSLSIMAILRDWSKLRVMQSDNYPRQQVVMIPIRRWTHEEQALFVKERIKIHQETAKAEEYPLCTPQERWRKEDSFAIMKTNRKSALRVLPTREQANQYLKDKSLLDSKEITIIHRKGEDVRCQNYCPVNQFCSYYMDTKTAF